MTLMVMGVVFVEMYTRDTREASRAGSGEGVDAPGPH